MKFTAAVLTILSLASAASADSIVLKNGKRIEWRTLRDRGDSYEVETADGLSQAVLKKDIERLDFTDVKPALTGASMSFEGKTKTVELLQGIAPKRDTVFGVVKYSGAALVVASEIDAPTLLRIPSKLPEEYDITMIVERRSVIGNFYVGLVGSGRPFLVEFDGSNGSMTSIHGGPSQRGAVLDKGQPKAILIQVRREAVVVVVDKKELLCYKGAAGVLQVPEQYQLPKNEAAMFVGAQRIVGTPEHANFQVHRISITTRP